MKKRFGTMILILLIACLSLFVTAPIVNDNIAEKTAAELAGLPLPDNTELVESVHKAGKLVGNGNGMQYFGAILIKSDLSLEELTGYYANLAENEWECVVDGQTDQEIKIIEHAELAFKADIADDDYYIVYSWGENHTIFHELDLRGH